MKRLQIYLSMYELLNENKKAYQLNGIDEFLEAANPFRLYDEQNISTRFIEAYDNYFKDKDYNEEDSYQFIITFLNEFDDKKVLSAFQLSSKERWLTMQQMIIH